MEGRQIALQLAHSPVPITIDGLAYRVQRSPDKPDKQLYSGEVGLFFCPAAIQEALIRWSGWLPWSRRNRNFYSPTARGNRETCRLTVRSFAIAWPHGETI